MDDRWDEVEGSEIIEDAVLVGDVVEGEVLDGDDIELEAPVLPAMPEAEPVAPIMVPGHIRLANVEQRARARRLLKRLLVVAGILFVVYLLATH